jgi:HEAT repeat protein
MKSIYWFLALLAGMGAGGFAQLNSPSAQDARKAEIERLMIIVSDEQKYATRNFTNDWPIVGDAIVRLGKLKAVEAIPVLVRHIDFWHPSSHAFSFGAYEILRGRVAAEALIQIGEPSIQPALEASKKEDKPYRLTCIAGVLDGVLGKERAIELVQSARTASTDPAETARFDKLKSFVDQPPSLYDLDRLR